MASNLHGPTRGLGSAAVIGAFALRVGRTMPLLENYVGSFVEQVLLETALPGFVNIMKDNENFSALLEPVQRISGMERGPSRAARYRVTGGSEAFMLKTKLSSETASLSCHRENFVTGKVISSKVKAMENRIDVSANVLNNEQQ